MMANGKNNLTQFNTDVDADLKKQFGRVADDRGLSIKEATDQALRAWIGTEQTPDDILARKFIYWKNNQKETTWPEMIAFVVGNVERFSK